ncbi:MAG TPA: STAS domain-containing protein [Leptospiraceae bacterium]|nr:STAS domain-containing protein [Leptospiraceae bacterium]HNF24910.1 STAS domain-containing protein [Leptospiraceae bacterium]HNI97521.1 STAS domain-containing protein [Leptospiraceae bacterium]HNN02280.1 STAS domain-containing protein [Leptospiraceae bacterium]HNO21561.1 STAS domain-containing protein [Leptospiraceae bacterium]
MQLKQEIKNRAGIVTVTGKIYLYEIHSLRETLEDYFQRTDLKHVILELSDVDFIDSSGIGLLVANAAKFKEKGVSFCLVNLNSSVEHLFRLTAIARLFKRFNSIDEALQS